MNKNSRLLYIIWRCPIKKNFTTNQHEPARTTTRYVQKVRGFRVVRG